MSLRGIRGATTVAANSAQEILDATEELLVRLVEANGVSTEEIASIFFTTTQDLNAAFPAASARRLGWTDLPLMGGVEAAIEGGLPLCIRVLILVNTDLACSQIRHVYLRGARVLRPDWSGEGDQ